MVTIRGKGSVNAKSSNLVFKKVDPCLLPSEDPEVIQVQHPTSSFAIFLPSINSMELDRTPPKSVNINIEDPEVLQIMTWLRSRVGGSAKSLVATAIRVLARLKMQQESLPAGQLFHIPNEKITAVQALLES